MQMDDSRQALCDTEVYTSTETLNSDAAVRGAPDDAECCFAEAARQPPVRRPTVAGRPET